MVNRPESDGLELGARFTFTLPTAEEAGALRYVRDPLMGSGFEPMATADPEEALGIVEEHGPHLVLLDPVPPGTDGTDLMKEIAEMTGLPIIFLSACGRASSLPGPSAWAPPTTWSGPSHPWSCRAGSGRHCAGERLPGLRSRMSRAN